MTKTASSYKGFFPSLVLLALALAALLADIAPKYVGSAGDMINFTQLFICVAVAVVVALCFGVVRYSLGLGLGLAAITLHDLLLTFSLTVLLGFVFEQGAIMPVLVIFAPVFTFVQSLPVIRAARDLRAATPQRDMSDAQVASEATKATGSLRIGSAVLALVFIVAGAFGGMKVVGTLIPLLAGVLASLYSSAVLTGAIWQNANAKSAKTRKK